MNAHIDPAVFERHFERAILEPTSMQCPYPDWDNPVNWLRFTGDMEQISDGEIMLVFQDSAAAPYAFRRYDASTNHFERRGGGYVRAEYAREVYRYDEQDDHETDICCPNLEDVL